MEAFSPGEVKVYYQGQRLLEALCRMETGISLGGSTLLQGIWTLCVVTLGLVGALLVKEATREVISESP